MSTYHIVPKSNPDDIYAAGRDGNEFATEQEALEAIPGLRECGPDFDIEWIVVNDWTEDSEEGVDSDGDCRRCGHPADGSSGHGSCNAACHG